MKGAWPECNERLRQEGSGLRPCYDSGLEQPVGSNRAGPGQSCLLQKVTLATGAENGLEGTRGYCRDSSPKQAIHTGGKHNSQRTREKTLSLACKQESAK